MNHPTTTTSDPLTVPARVRLVDVAREAGVSIATVSAVLMPRAGNNTRVSAATAARVTDVAARMNFQPNQAARQLAGKRSGMLGVIVDSMAPEVHFRLLAQLEKSVGERGYRMMVGQSHDRPETLVNYVRDFASRGVDGLFCLAHDYPAELYPSDAAQMIFDAVEQVEHVVFIGRSRDFDERLHCVFSDASVGMIEAYRHLRAGGRQKIGLVLYNQWYQTHQDRMRGFLTMARSFGEKDPEGWVYSQGKERLGGSLDGAVIAEAIEMLVVNRKADALIASNDLVAIQLIKELKKSGRRIPEDVAVIGYDNLQSGSLYEPSITSIDQNTPEICREAVATMLQMIQGNQDAKRSIQVNPYLVKRDSA